MQRDVQPLACCLHGWHHHAQKHRQRAELRVAQLARVSEADSRPQSVVHSASLTLRTMPVSRRMRHGTQLTLGHVRLPAAGPAPSGGDASTASLGGAEPLSVVPIMQHSARHGSTQTHSWHVTRPTLRHVRLPAAGPVPSRGDTSTVSPGVAEPLRVERITLREILMHGARRTAV